MQQWIQEGPSWVVLTWAGAIVLPLLDFLQIHQISLSPVFNEGDQSAEPVELINKA